jgi:hypothetical protein
VRHLFGFDVVVGVWFGLLCCEDDVLDLSYDIVVDII